MTAKTQRTNPLLNQKIVEFHKCIQELELAGAWKLASDFRKILLKFMAEAGGSSQSASLMERGR